MKAEDLKAVLADHAKWLANPSQGRRADLTGANLTRAYLTGANLTRANLTRADLTRANLTRAYLTRAYLNGAYLNGADLNGADFNGADLTGAYLNGADLTRANFTRANFTGADLTRANLTDANFTRANLTGADLNGANLTGANLTGADLTRADLTRANLTGAKLGHRAIVPPTGKFTAWKKLRMGVIAELEVIGPRVSPYTDRKCRCVSARVVALHGAAPYDHARSIHDENFVYRVGEIVSVPDANLDPREVCTAGIHFFLTREEAEAYEG